MKAYLLLYNGACMLGWLFCVLRAGQMLLGGSTYAQIYGEIGMVLMASQTAMCLEILHSLTGLVPSPVGVVTLQVGSRIFIVWGHLYWVPECQSHWSFMFITFSWGITEVVRYLFYFCSLLGGVPYPIFYFRYSMFMVLYPSGITVRDLPDPRRHGSLLEAFESAVVPLELDYSALVRAGQPRHDRQHAWEPQAQLQEAKRDEGRVVGRCLAEDEEGDRSSTSTNQKMLAAAAAKGPGGEEAASRILKEKKWRFAYNKHLLEHVSQSLQSEAGCIAMARAGLESAQESFQFIRDGHEEMSMKVAMEKLGTNPFDSAEVCGVKDAPSKRELSLTYGAPMLGAPYYKFKAQRNTKITGMDLRKQLDKWGEYGTVEQDVVDALKTLQGKQDEWLDLSDMYFVLLGAASAMGPLHFLLSLGANVIAIARPKALMGILKQAKNGPGKVIFPVAKGTDWKGLLAKGDYDALAKVSGCDLMTQTPEIAAWVAAVAPGKRLTIGNYTYLDGALHVQVAVACDCIMQRLCKERKDTALAFLCTPTDAHVVTKEAAVAAIEAHKTAPLWMKIWEGVGVLKRNQALTSNGIEFMDAIVPDQGPNYILSKRLQHWRAMVARADGHAASSNVSPSTATSSVTSNASFAAAYGGMHIFKPLEVVYQELSLSMMAALLIHDLRNPASAAQPATKLQHPLCLFQATSFHGGIWRCPYTIATIGIPCALKFYLTTFWMHIFVAFAALASTVQYGMYGTLPKAVGQALSLIPAALVQQVSAPLVSLAAALSVPL
eukprot:CAMPEP_0177168360 /NCGR_PEP_ID=MMETSP0367-20130122/9024_1 /TAXON_ID=447022 ORGANISM="Scrippsiella hangoei-like, Strain SHHI-4" /NCGR_SAMPLE_ID=MMETSP0367 /ASSEMBLY_ACC=CAM_ASM_000362 /LENGTH=775 /DNA_ID=CAMNT_0018614487 /DNA_START=73 /DNA_END=2401 /DNA_ORIENTATION=-